MSSPGFDESLSQRLTNLIYHSQHCLAQQYTTLCDFLYLVLEISISDHFQRIPRRSYETGTKLNRKMLWVYLLAILFAGSFHAQDFTGNRQRTLVIPLEKPPRIVLQFTRDESPTRKATFYSIDQSTDRSWLDSITMQDSTVNLVLRLLQGAYEGKLSNGGNSITGTRIHGSLLALIFQNASTATAWTLDT